MATVLGLDLGSYAIKGLLFEASLRGYQRRDYGEVPRQEGERLESLRQSLGDFFRKYPITAEQVVIALPGPSLASHVLTLPFTDTKRIEAALPFEVESQLPFDLSEAVFDYQITGQHDKQSDLFVGEVKQEELRNLLSMLKDLNVDTRIVTHPAVEYQSYLLSAPQLFQGATNGSSIAVVDLGHERTSVTIGRPSVGLDFGRTFARGGRHLTKAIASELQIGLPEAGQWKETRAAFGSSPPDPEEARVADAMSRALQPTIRELRATIKAFTGRSHRTVAPLFLCDATPNLPALYPALPH